MKIADTVEISRDTKVFKVDGEEFPWWVTDRGIRVQRVKDNLYTVKVDILCMGKPDVRQRLTFSCTDTSFTIGDVEFPWMLTNKGVQFTMGPTQYPAVRLSFFARSVDSDYAFIDDVRDIYNINGERVA